MQPFVKVRLSSKVSLSKLYGPWSSIMCQFDQFKTLNGSVHVGSGKSYTMMGSMQSGGKGIIPRLCDLMFDRIAELRSEDTSFKVEVSYMEIYNEKVHDLLDPKG